MEMTGTIKDIIRKIRPLDGDKTYDVKLSVHREKRSRNANNYAWSLITKIANELNISKEECYLMMLKDYGQSETLSVLETIDPNKYFKYYSDAGRSNVNGVPLRHYRVYRGSSEYNTKEMAIFIDGVVSEAEMLDIETLTPQELSLLKEGWNNETQ